MLAPTAFEDKAGFFTDFLRDSSSSSNEAIFKRLTGFHLVLEVLEVGNPP